MNAKTTLTALVLAAGFAGSAFAESPTVVNDTFSGSRTRAEVQAELAAYKKAGVNPWSTTYNPLRSFRSAASRDAVVADYIASRNEVRALTGEDSGSQYLAQRQLPASTQLAHTAR
ncbi:MAG TPA: DUF4148 domain-containing protein [Ramlibacter sp.]|nr:DUF4148 domain-containing protein [Ramlibacter sp.]